ncbi:MAG: ABC transporter substrate-binding protein [Prevotella sp.]|nr:ABC transporter substrate-binding protein [Prevotella sp.]
MIRKLLDFYYMIAVLLVLASCKGGSTAASLSGADSIEMKYSRLLTLQRGDGFTLAEIRNPWDTTRVLHSYVLVPKDRELPAELPDGDIIRTPLERSVFYTSMHTALVCELGASGAVAGICNPEYITTDTLRKGLDSGRIVNCGDGSAPNIEKIIELAPDAILLSPFENSGSYGKLGSIGVPIIECADYMETGTLGRAEWMRFYGLLVGKAEKADSLFAEVEKDYNQLKSLVGSTDRKPTVVDGNKFGSTWYVAGANSTIGRMISDAGGSYVFSGEKATGSVPYAPEVVFEQAQNAQVWMMKYSGTADMTYAQLAREWANYAEMGAFKRKNIYACNLRKVAFYEETPFHPNLLLRDYIKIFHPEILKDHELRYYKRIEK